MKIVVTEGYLSMGGKLCRRGEILDVADDLAARLIAGGTVAASGASPAAVAVQEDSPVPGDDVTEEITLPEADPAAAVTSGKRGRAKR